MFFFLKTVLLVALLKITSPQDVLPEESPLERPPQELKCHTGKNFKIFCGFRQDSNIFEDRCQMVPDSEAEPETYDKIPDLKTCPGKDDEYECFLTMKYPKITDELVSKMFKVEIEKTRIARAGKFDKGVEIEAIEAGCRKKDQQLQEYRTKQDHPEDFPLEDCVSLDGEGEDLKINDLEVEFGGKEISCGCVGEPCPCGKKNHMGCNNHIQIPVSLRGAIYYRKEALKEKRQQEWLELEKKNHGNEL